MRILILTHGRSGGLSISSWIEKELGLTLFHEPFIQNDIEFLKNVLYKQDNIIVKDFPFNIIKKGLDLNDFMQTFDKIIIHKRVNLRDTAISTVNGSIKARQDKNKVSHWHETYKINQEWLLKNKQKIEQELLDNNIRNNDLYDIYENKTVIGLRTTYENVFENTDDISRMIEYLEIVNPKWLDVLSKRHKLRNGDVGMDDYLMLNPNKFIETKRRLL